MSSRSDTVALAGASGRGMRGRGPTLSAALAVTAAAAATWALLTLAPRDGLVTLVLIAAAVFALAVLRRPELAVWALVGAAALDVTGRLGSFGGVTVTVYQAVAGLTAGLLVWLAARHGVATPRTPLDAPVLLLLGLAVAGIPGAVEPRVALVMTVSLVSSAFLLYAVVMLIREPQQARRVVWGILALASLVGLLAVLERMELYSVQPWLRIWGYGVRSRVTFKDPNHLGTFLMVSAALAVPMALAARRAAERYAAFLGIGIVLAGLYSTYSRGAWGGMAVAILAVAALARVPFHRKVALVLVVVLLALSVASFAISPKWIEERVLSLDEDNSWLARIRMGESALRMSSDYPMGVGLGGYPIIYPDYRDASVRFNLVESHTAYLTVLVELGPLGLMAFLWLLGSFFWTTWRSSRHTEDPIVMALAVGAFAATLAIAAQSFTYSLEASKYLWLSLGLGMSAAGMVAVARREGAEGGL